MNHSKGSFSRGVVEIGVWIVAIVYLLPLYLEITIALKSPEDFALNPFGLPATVVFSNITTAWKMMDVFRVMGNSLLLTLIPISVVVLISSMAAYAIARRNSRLFQVVYIFFIAGMMVPFQLIMIPLYQVIKALHMMNSYQGIIFIYIASGIPLAVMVFTGFIRSIPRELDEAAMIDGCNKFTIYFRIVLPFLKAASAPVIVFNVVQTWNDLLTPLIFLGGGKDTLIMALYHFKGAVYTTDWTMVFSGALITMIPLVLLFLFLQKYFVKGLMSGAIK